MDHWRIDGNGSTLPTPHSTSRTPLPNSFIPPVRSSSLPPYLQARPTPTRTLTDPLTPSSSLSNTKAPQLPPIYIPKSNFTLRPAPSASSCTSQGEEEEQEWSYTSSSPDTPQSCTPLLHTQFSISNMSLSSLSSDESESHSARSPSPFLATTGTHANMAEVTGKGTKSDDLATRQHAFDSNSALHFAFDECGESVPVGRCAIGELSSWIPSSFTSCSSSSEDDENVCTPCVRVGAGPPGMEEVKLSQLSPTRGSYHTVLPYTNAYGPSISSSLGTGVGMGAEIGVGTAPCFTTSQSALVSISASASDPVSVIPISAPGGDTGIGTAGSLALALSLSQTAEASASGSTFSSASALPSPSPSMSTSSYSRNPSPLPPPLTQPQIQPQPQSIQLSLSLPTTPRRSSLVRTQSTPAFNILSSSPSCPSSPSPSPYSQRKRAFTTFNSTASSPVSTPIRSPSKRFVSAVRVAMRDLRDVVGRLKSPERGSGSGRDTPSSVFGDRNRSGALSPAPSTPGLGRERSGRLARRGTSYFAGAKEGMGEESGGWRSTIVGVAAVGV